MPALSIAMHGYLGDRSFSPAHKPLSQHGGISCLGLHPSTLMEEKRRRGTSGREGDGLAGVGEEEGGRRRISAEEKRGSAGRKEGE